MSFIERNKAWVLPLLGVAAAGVIYMNVKMLGPSAKTAAATAPPPLAAPAPGIPAARPASVAPPPPPAPAKPGAQDLWSDLRALEEPWAGLNQPEAILAQGGGALKAEALHPLAKSLPLPASLRVSEPRTATVPGATPVSPAASAPPPEVDFLIRNSKGASAWLGGSGFQVGQVLAGGWRVRRITPDMVEVEGPGGLLRRWTNPLKARTASPAPIPEAP